MLGLHEMPGSGRVQDGQRLLDETEILWGEDALGALICGHARNALRYGSRLSIQETRALAPFQNATGLQVTSAVLAGMVWALENPEAGIVETDEMDHARCLEIQRPYLGRIGAHSTDWTPIASRWTQFAEEIDEDDPRQFENVPATLRGGHTYHGGAPRAFGACVRVRSSSMHLAGQATMIGEGREERTMPTCVICHCIDPARTARAAHHATAPRAGRPLREDRGDLALGAVHGGGGGRA